MCPRHEYVIKMVDWEFVWSNYSNHKIQCKGVQLDRNLCAFTTVRPDVMKLHEKKHIKEVPDLEEVPPEDEEIKHVNIYNGLFADSFDFEVSWSILRSKFLVKYFALWGL